MTSRIVLFVVVAGVSAILSTAGEAQQCARGGQNGQSGQNALAMQTARMGTQFGNPLQNQLARSTNQFGVSPQMLQQRQNAYVQQLMMQNAAAQVARVNASRERRLAAVKSRRDKESSGSEANGLIAATKTSVRK